MLEVFKCFVWFAFGCLCYTVGMKRNAEVILKGFMSFFSEAGRCTIPRREVSSLCSYKAADLSVRTGEQVTACFWDAVKSLDCK